MRWYLEQLSDPRHTWDAVFEGGEVTLRRTAPDGEAEVESFTFASEDDAVEGMRARLPDPARGFVQVDPPDERYRNHPRIAQFWREQVETEWRALGATPCEPTELAEVTTRYFGRALPPELAAHLAFRSTHQLGFCNYGEWRLWDSDLWLPRSEDGNLFEQLVCMDQDNILATAMMQYFVGWVPVGSAGNGDLYLACPNAYDPGRCDVIFFDHATHSIQTFIADSLASLAWLNRCYRQLQDEGFDPATLREDFGLIADRTNLPWHYGDLETETGVEPSMRLSTVALRDFRRCRWIDYLLSQARIGDVADLFDPEVNGGSFSDALASPYLRRWTSTALYWAWRLWWFDKPELSACLDALADHPSPIVTDCVALIRSLEAGRKQLGRIEDIHALRAQFLALDLDPERAEARALEQVEAEEQARRRTEARAAAARALIATGAVEAIRDALWDYADEPAVTAELVAWLEVNDAEAGPQLRRWRFLAERRSQRDGKSYAFEDEEVREALSHDGAIVAPLFSRPSDLRRLLPAAFGGARALPVFREALRSDDEFRRGTTAGAKGLAALGDTDSVPELIALTRSLRWKERDFIAKTQNDDALLATLDALAALGGDGVTEALLALLEVGALEEDVWPRVYVALGRLGDPAAVPTLIAHLDGDARPVLYALAHIGGETARDAIDRHLATKLGDTAQLAYELGMQQLARHHTAAEVDWELVESLTQIVESRRYEDQELHETLAILLAEHPDDERAVELLLPYLHHDHRRVRDAAIESLDALGELPELRWMDRATVDALWEAEGLDGLRDALTDPHAIFRHNLVRKAVDEGVGAELADEAVALGRLYCRFTAYTHPYTQSKHTNTYYLVRALIELEADAADRFLCALWKGPVPMYREAEDLKYKRDWLVERMQRFLPELQAEQAAHARPPTEEPAAPATSVADPFGRVAWLFGGCVNGMCWTPDGEHLVVGGVGGVKILDRDGQRVRDIACVRGAHVYDVDVSPDGALLAIGAHGGHLLLVDATTGEQAGKLVGHGGVPSGVRKVRFSPSGALLASVSDDRTARVWDVAGRAATMVYTDPADINAVDWVDEQHLVIGTDRMVRLLTSAGDEVKAKPASGTAETRVCRERERIYVGSAGKLRAYSLKLAEKRKEHLAQTSLSRIRVAGDTLVATSWEGDDAGVSLWDLTTGTRKRPEPHRRRTFALDLHPQTRAIGIGGDPGYIERFTVAGAPLPLPGSFHTQEIEGLRGAGDEVLTAGKDHQVIRWSADGEVLASYRSDHGRLCDAASDGERVYVTGSDFAAAFDRATGAPLWTATPAGRSEHLALAADGTSLVLAGKDNLTWLDRATGEPLHATEPFIGNWWLHWWAELSAGRLAVAGYSDEHLHVFDTARRERVGTFALPKSKKGAICGLAAAAGALYVSRWDATLVILDDTDGQVRRRVSLAGTRAPVAVTEDGATLFACSGRGVEVYDTATFRHLATVEAPAKVSALTVVGERLIIGCVTGEVATAPARAWVG